MHSGVAVHTGRRAEGVQAMVGEFIRRNIAADRYGSGGLGQEVAHHVAYPLRRQREVPLSVQKRRHLAVVTVSGQLRQLRVGLQHGPEAFTVDLRGAIGFSSFGVLLYYFVANLAAFTQPADRRRFPRALQILGAAGCLVLAATLPWQTILAGGAVFLAGIAYRLVRARQQEG